MASGTAAGPAMGIVGLGKMGSGIARRLHRAGISVIAFDPAADARANVEGEGVETVGDVQALVSRLDRPRMVWLMVPAGEATEQVSTSMAGLLADGDILIDGGNSDYRESMRRAARLAERGISFLDVGTSGGVYGEAEGYCLMAGGDAAAVSTMSGIFSALAASGGDGWLHVGPSGAGHFVKMIHNGIEYGMMQAMAEGFAVLDRKHEFDIDLARVAELWRHGSVVRSWLLDLVADTLAQDAALQDIAPFVSDSGEGRWTVREAIDLNVSAPVITLSLLQRIRSRDTESYADRMLSAMRAAFGGHAVRRPADD